MRGPPPTVHLRTVKSNIDRLCFVGKRIYRRLRLFKYLKNISILQLYEQFSRNVRNFNHFWLSEKISNSLKVNKLFIILKHVI